MAAISFCHKFAAEIHSIDYRKNKKIKNPKNRLKMNKK